MAYFEDLGSTIDAPIDVVWAYLTSEGHGAAHAESARNFAVRETVGATAVIAAERKLDGRWSTFVSKSADYPPVCICNEEVEGDFAGTKFVLVYKPDGARTRVDVYGDVRSAVLPPETAKAKFLELLAGAYADDVKGVRAFRAAP
jgi:hypothetical protein